jgi:serine protease Do
MLVGDTTFVIGAPLDADTYSWTVTRGILSGKDRLVEVSSSTYKSVVMNVLQTDTAINNGNSGGPICNANGEVIGIVNMKLSSSKIEGMGFAIPIEVALEYAENFIDGKVITRPYLGVSMYDLSSSIFSTETGIYLKAVESGSPADKAGLKEGDIITKVNGKEVETTAYLKYELYKYKVGDEIEITYKRNNKEATTKVTLGSYDVRG